jgi:ribosome-binding factor A
VNNARTTPKLRFVFDVSIVRGARMSKLIDDAVAVDREHAADRGDTDE